MEIKIFKSILLAILVASIETGAVKLKDILLILVDDLRLSTNSRFLNIPNISKLAQTGVTFTNAYAQQALCAPSRHSLLTGRMPDALRVYDLHSYWRDSNNCTTLPQLLKQHGYHTRSVGKIFHPGVSSNFTDDYPYSWSVAPYHPSTLEYKDSPVCTDADGSLRANLLCPVDVGSQPSGTLPDLQSLDEAVDILRNRNRSVPLFLAVGFYKPHIPLKCPEEYMNIYPLSSIKLSKYNQRPYDMPLSAWHPSMDVRRRHDINQLNVSFPFGLIPDVWAKRIKQNYFACMSYVDTLIGRLIEHTDEDFVVVLLSDHGWSLGDNGLWAKYSNFDSALKVPLLIKSPQFQHKQVTQPVELIDVFPTLVELSRLDVEVPQCGDREDKLCFEGRSLVPLMRSVERGERTNIARSQCPRPGTYPAVNSDRPRRNDIKVMGYSIRNGRFRYTEWIEFNGKNCIANWSNVYGVELYDHSIDGAESMNLFNRPGLEKIVRKFKKQLRKNFEKKL